MTNIFEEIVIDTNLLCFCNVKAIKAIEKPKKNLKCPQKKSGAECDRESVESGDSNASDSDSSSSLNSDSENMEVKLIRTLGRPRGSKHKGLLIYVVIFMSVNVII